MEMRFLGRSGMRVSELCLGTMTFGGKGQFFAGTGSVDVEDARRMVDICFDRGVNLFDTADVYSEGLSEEFLGKALLDKRDRVLIATKVHGRTGTDSNDVGGSRHHIIRACEASLRRLATDHIDLYQLHGFDANARIEQTISALDTLVRVGKVRYIGCSNFSAWQLMKALSIAERTNREPFISQQVYYSLVARELEFELVPLALDQGIGTIVWSPLAGGFLSGKYRRGRPAPVGSRGESIGLDGVLDIELGYRIITELESIAQEHEATPAQVALNWLRRKPHVSSLILGARNLAQLTSALDCLEWDLTADEEQRLDQVSAPTVPYPYWHQQKYNDERGTLASEI